MAGKTIVNNGLGKSAPCAMGMDFPANLLDAGSCAGMGSVGKVKGPHDGESGLRLLQFNLKRLEGIEVNIPLREGNRDIRGAEQPVDRETQVGLDFAQIHRAGDRCPKPHFKDKGVVSEFLKKDLWWWIFQHFGMFDGCLHEEIFHKVAGRAVGDADGNNAADISIEQGPVDDYVFEENAVGNEEIDSVRAADSRAAITDFLDPALPALQFDNVTDPDRTLDHENQPRDKIVEEVLRTETEPDGDRSAHDRENGDGNAGDG